MPSAPAKTVCQQNSGNRWNQAAERVNKIVVPEFVDAFSGPCRRPCRPRPAVVGDIAPASFIQPCQQTPGNHWNQAVFPVNKIVATGLVDTLPLMIVGQSRPSRRVTADIPPPTGRDAAGRFRRRSAAYRAESAYCPQRVKRASKHRYCRQNVHRSQKPPSPLYDPKERLTEASASWLAEKIAGRNMLPRNRRRPAAGVSGRACCQQTSALDYVDNMSQPS